MIDDQDDQYGLHNQRHAISIMISMIGMIN